MVSEGQRAGEVYSLYTLMQPTFEFSQNNLSSTKAISFQVLTSSLLNRTVSVFSTTIYLLNLQSETLGNTNSFLTFNSMDRTLKCHHSLESC